MKNCLNNFLLFFWGERLKRTVYARFEVEADSQETAEEVVSNELHWVSGPILRSEVVDIVPELIFDRAGIEEFLENQLNREPTDAEVDNFIEFLSNDTYEWEKENFRSWEPPKTETSQKGSETSSG